MTGESTPRSPLLHRNVLQELPGSFLAVLIGLYATLIPFLTNPKFFFNDDEQNQHYPYFIDIGQHLRHHQWPGITLSTFYGGNLIIDWQYALFNPFSLLLYWIICPIQNLLLVGLFLVGIYLTLLSLGGYWLGRVFSVNRIFSLTIAACLVMNNFIQYVYCDSWITGLISITWFIWAWVLLEQYRKGGHTLSLGALVCLIYLTITSGFPHTMLALAFLMFAYFLELVFIQRSQDKALKLLMINVGAFMATAPFLLPALFSFSLMVRPNGIQSAGMFMPDLGSVLNLSSTFYCPRIHLFWHEYPYYPMMYLGWFIIPLLPIICWQTAAFALRPRLGLIIFGSIALFMLMGPESLGPIRWPIRFLPFFHISILVAFFLVISAPGVFRITKFRLGFIAAILVFQFTSSVSVFPHSLSLQVIVCGCSFVMFATAIRLVHYKNLHPLGLLFLAGMLLCFPFTHLIAPINVDLIDSNPTIQNDSANPTAARPFSGYQMLISPLTNDNRQDIGFAAEGIYAGTPTINGYSSLEHVGLLSRTHGHVWFEVPDTDGVDFLFAIEPTTHESRLSLMRVNRVLLFNDYFDYAKPAIGRDWIPTSRGEFATRLENSAPNDANTTLSFASEGIAVTPKGEVTGEHEQLQITANPNGGQLVFARLFWPGYEAYLDGKPIAVQPLDNIFVKLNLPPRALGELTLSFVPPGFKLGLILASIGLALCCATLLINSKDDGVRASN